MFTDRLDAAMKLADALKNYKNEEAVVMAIPRGGVPIGYVIAKKLHLPLDVMLIKKIGYPMNQEYAIGAVSMQGRIVNKNIEVDEEYIEAETKRIREMLNERYHKYMGDRKPTDLKGKTVIIVDDGIATGQTMQASIDIAKKNEAKKIVIAVPVGPPETIQKFRRQVDEVVCLETPEVFFAVGQFYQNFDQTEDAEVISFLKQANADSN
ncbi:MAG: phosphoribosyltransferase [Bacteroidia bacterium]